MRTDTFCRRALTAAVTALTIAGCCMKNPPEVGPDISRVKLITLDPGHFHAALVQKTMYPQVDPVVHVYAPSGDDLAEHLKRITSFNTRTTDPTHWQEDIYAGPDYFEKMLAAKTGNVIVIAGNNQKKTDYIYRSVQAGMHVLADKPMVVTPAELPRLQAAFKLAESKHVLLYDIMTERFEVNTRLQRALSQQPLLFGKFVQGTPEQPAITMESVHYFSKTVAGSVLKRPAWFFDVRQEGEGLQDVGTHLVDLVQWIAYPEQPLQISDVQVLTARRWPTTVTHGAFTKMTGEAEFPASLKGDVKGDALQVYANGDMTYRLRGTVAKVTAKWDVEAPAGGDTHYALMRGTLANLVIRQGAAENYKPVLYVEKPDGIPFDDLVLESHVSAAVAALQVEFPGVAARRKSTTPGPDNNVWVITVPEKYDVGHEAHFAQVTENFLGYLRQGKLPAWEVPNMLTKYATLMKAYELSR